MPAARLRLRVCGGVVSEPLTARSWLRAQTVVKRRPVRAGRWWASLPAGCAAVAQATGGAAALASAACLPATAASSARGVSGRGCCRRACWRAGVGVFRRRFQIPRRRQLGLLQVRPDLQRSAAVLCRRARCPARQCYSAVAVDAATSNSLRCSGEEDQDGCEAALRTSH